jgi:hypothetical protein
MLTRRDRQALHLRQLNADRGRCRAAVGIAPVTRLSIALLLLLQVVAIAQDVTEPALKAAYIYNFAKFTEWPGTAPAAGPFVMCVLGDVAVGEALERAVVGRALAGRPIVTSRVIPSDPKRACHLLYVSGLSVAQAGSVVADLHELPVLTISDIEGFTDVGGIAQLFFEHGQLRFRIQLDPAKRARLQISSRLLILAKPK